MEDDILRIAIAKLELGPNDILVVRSKRTLSAATVDQLRGNLAGIVPNKIVVLEDGMVFEKIVPTE